MFRLSFRGEGARVKGLLQPEPCNADLRRSLCIQRKLLFNGAKPEIEAKWEHLRKSRCADELILTDMVLTNIIGCMLV